MNVKKRDGTIQEFEKNKLKASIKKAGSNEANATKVTENVARQLREGMPTADIKRQAATELRRMDQTAAQRYESFKLELAAR